MYKYKVYGLIIESDTVLKPLIKVEGDCEPQISIRSGRVSQEVEEWLSRKANGQKYDIGFEYSCFKNKGGFYVIKNGRDIIYETNGDYTAEMIEPWLLGFCLTMALLQRQILAIHCSAVACEDGAVLISGVPGAGKSTLTKALMERGYKFMADDIAAVTLDAGSGSSFVHPGFPYQKLCRNEVEKRELDEDDLIYIDEDKDKYLVPVGDAFVGDSLPLKALIFVVVGTQDEVSVQQLSGLNQLMALRQNLFLHKLEGAWENNKELLELCLKVAGSCKIYLIIRPAEKDTVNIMCDEAERIINN